MVPDNVVALRRPRPAPLAVALHVSRATACFLGRLPRTTAVAVTDAPGCVVNRNFTPDRHLTSPPVQGASRPRFPDSSAKDASHA